MPLSMRHALPWLLAILLSVSPLGVNARADTLSEDKAKAGFIFNFTKYTEWPAATQTANHLLVCSLEASPLSGKLVSLQGQQARGREIRFQAQINPNELRDCQVLFISVNEMPRIESVLRTIAQHPVLTISDAPGFAQVGGIIGLKLRSGRIRFDINQGAARQAGLKLSSQLLKLADEVLP